MRTRRSVTAALAAAVAIPALAACTATPVDRATTTTAPPTPDGGAVEEKYTPVVMDVMSTPRWFTGTDELVHVVYELRLTNAFPVDATIERVVVRDAADGAVVETLEDDTLAAAFSLQPLGLPDVTALAPSTVGVVWLDVAFDDPAAIPAEIDHQLTVRVAPGLPVPEQITSTGARAEVDADPPTTIGPPLVGEGWVAVGSCCDGPHRRALQPVNDALWLAQRFAIDFNRVDGDDYFATGDPGLNESWPTYDQPVIAVADAEVVASADRFPDQVSLAPEPVTLDEADGNYVILRIAEGVYAFYAHLKPGTVAVVPGDTVAKGEEIGRTGNSGSSTGPHLHFQMMDRPSALLADGVPYVFDRFTLEGRTPPLAEVMAADPQTTPVEIDDATTGDRTDELPLGRDVVAFADLGR
ncbi:M23 family metallopeptidase [Microbacterium sp. RD1]|uniref:M23 family metallopeptidase n=1 Tax=Microbacterium sp. RD1 TaxID=3457313 RepID=UPI003FA53A23